LISFAIATAAIVEPGPTGVSSPSIRTRASPSGVHRSMTTSAWSSRRVADEWVGEPPSECSTEVTAITGSPRRRAPCAISIGTADSPPTLKTIIVSGGRRSKLARIVSASPSTPSMNIACRCPFAPTTCVWKVSESSTIGLKPGYEP
jgi:hypothetical protein